MKKYLFLAITIVCLTAANAQTLTGPKQTYNWTFGTYGGLTWNTTRSFTVAGKTAGATATSLTNLPSNFTSSINTVEGCFTLSDVNGNLMFYSDGMTIWNKNNVAMSNGTGMTGNASSTQSGIIFPYPGNTNQYVAVTLGDAANVFAYSVVDMSLNAGLGNVVVGKKNLSFPTWSGSVAETVTAFRHANAVDYWVIAPGAGTTTYLNAWRFTSSGPLAPVKTALPTGLTTSVTVGGYIKISPDGKHFIWPTGSNGTFIVGDFDTNTGAFTNIKKVSDNYTNSNKAYGSEFSPDGTLIYICATQGLYVYKADDLFTNPTTAVANRKLYTGLYSTPGALQLGPDRRIYGGVYGTKNMYIINNPNEFSDPGIYFATNFTTGTINLGLPSFASSWFSVEIVETAFTCAGNNGNFQITVAVTGSDVPTRLSWDFGDGSPIVNDPIIAGKTVYTQSHAYADANKYNITITPYKADNTAQTPIKTTANIVDCMIKSNRMIRVNLPNTAENTLKATLQN
jgi:hypothetical protein